MIRSHVARDQISWEVGGGGGYWCVDLADVALRSRRRKLVLDDGEEGVHFRRFHASTIHIALDILVRNSG